jgi:hypothetical protein
MSTTIYVVHVRGTGQLNGPRAINKFFETEDLQLASSFMGQGCDIVLESFVATHYPGVKITPQSVSAQISIKKRKETKEKKESKTESRPQQTMVESESIFRAPIWLIPFRIWFLPFRLIGYLIKFLWKIIKWIHRD